MLVANGHGDDEGCAVGPADTSAKPLAIRPNTITEHDMANAVTAIVHITARMAPPAPWMEVRRWYPRRPSVSVPVGDPRLN
jgi:hypothetical protein